MLTKFNPAGMPTPPFYSQGALVTQPAQTLYVSGQVGVLPDGTVPDDIGAQAQAAVANLTRVLDGAGMTVDNLAKVTIYLTDAADIQAFAGATAGTLPVPPPATTLLIVAALGGPGLRVEIEAIAVK